MGWKEFFASIIDSISWPIMVLLVVFVLRERLGSLLGRVLKFKYKDTELEFSEAMKSIEAEVRIGSDIKRSQISETLSAERTRLDQVSFIAPRAAVLQAWNHVDRPLTDLQLLALEDAQLREINVREMLSLIRKAGVPNETIEAISHLRTVRNAVGGDTFQRIDREQVDSFISLALEVAEELNELVANKRLEATR